MPQSGPCISCAIRFLSLRHFCDDVPSLVLPHAFQRSILFRIPHLRPLVFFFFRSTFRFLFVLAEEKKKKKKANRSACRSTGMRHNLLFSQILPLSPAADLWAGSLLWSRLRRLSGRNNQAAILSETLPLSAASSQPKFRADSRSQTRAAVHNKHVAFTDARPPVLR